MSSWTITEEGLAFNTAFSALRFASTDKERSAASLIVREELERQRASIDSALKRQTSAREEEFARERARLEEALRRDLTKEGNLAEVRKACVDLCIEKMDSDPEEAALYASVILSWCTEPDGVLPNPPSDEKFWHKVKEEIERIHRRIFSLGIGTKLPADLRVPRMKPEKPQGPEKSRPLPITCARVLTPSQVQRISGSMEVILKNRGHQIPPNELSVALSSSVRLENIRDAKLTKWKEVTTAAAISVGVVADVITTLQALKNMDREDMEPLLACRHYLPAGWFF